MTSNEILRADLLDILFDRRNKDYGAYTLRKFYGNRLVLSLGIALSTTLLLFLFTGTHHTAAAVVRSSGDEVIVRTAVIAPPKVEPPKPVIPRSSVAVPQAKLTAEIRIVKNAAAIADMDQLKRSVVSTTTIDVPFSGPLPATPPAPVVSAPPAPAPAPVPAATALVSREPQFPGGMSAWTKFLERNLHSPSDLGAGERKTVVVNFYVSTEGVVTDFEVLQSAGREYDEEVIRVLRRMPKWSPALVNSQPVARSFKQAVTFAAAEE